MASARVDPAALDAEEVLLTVTDTLFVPEIFQDNRVNWLAEMPDGIAYASARARYVPR